jgi:hypothetical protein
LATPFRFFLPGAMWVVNRPGLQEAGQPAIRGACIV